MIICIDKSLIVRVYDIKGFDLIALYKEYICIMITLHRSLFLSMDVHKDYVS